jgi:hypothetical protein
VSGVHRERFETTLVKVAAASGMAVGVPALSVSHCVNQDPFERSEIAVVLADEED